MNANPTTLTQEQYDEIANSVARSIPNYLCDPFDAASEGFMVALKIWDGVHSFAALVQGCARIYALGQARKHKRVILSEDIDDQSEFADSFSDRIAYEDAPLLDNMVDPIFVDRITQILRDFQTRATVFDYSEDTKRRLDEQSRERSACKNARVVLKTFLDAANQGAGVGVDEYENDANRHAQTEWGTRRNGEYAHDAKAIKTQLNTRLMRELKMSYGILSDARRVLKTAARQALNEGWL